MKERLIPARLSCGDSAWADDGTLDEAGVFEGQVLEKVTWNGFAVPCFTREQVEKLIAYMTAPAQQEPGGEATLYGFTIRMVWEEREDNEYGSPDRQRLIVYEEDDPHGEDVGPDERGLYWPGAFSWAWSRIIA